MSIFLTADLHLNHENIIKHCHRPFKDVVEMNYTVLKNWNEVVRPNDDVYILGDVCWCQGERANLFIKAFNGRKYLIRGNHDRLFLDDKAFDKSLFQWVKDYYVLHHNHERLVLCHYPIYEWDGFYRSSIHCFGHVHETATMDRPNAFNVGQDVNGFAPVNIDDIISRKVIIPKGR